MIRKNDNDNIHIYIKLNKNIKIIQIEIPYMDILMSSNDIKFKLIRDIETKKKSLNKKKKDVSISFLMNSWKKLYKHKNLYNFMTYFKNYILNKIRIEDFYFVTKIGHNDAAVSAFISGILWSIKSIILCYIYKKYKLINFKYDVNTIYNKNIFEIDFNCIVKFKIVYIIKGFIFSILSIMKGGEVHG
ncbi:DUF2953 domain-containing protein [Clostridium sp. D2Q-14]|uniref:DUF2953 domain-containing protein n=1 Tax=Anaeromonas gelatinilytica TaxID=2683194 RepID=UPI00193BDB62|nr:DUF2953 domain-containing protein [Anaeromonas gelatinilytica]MBS4536236.1 DUF2953 domain-containing protein [Anaeromonas gelatinilytica]